MDKYLRFCESCGLNKPLSQFRTLYRRALECSDCRAAKQGLSVTKTGSNVRMVDQRIGKAILSVINQL